MILPTSDRDLGGHRVRLLLPLWLQKDFPGGTALFGGGGYLINPGTGNRNFWQAAVAVTHDFGDRVSAGVELTRQGPEAVGETAQTRLGVGSIVRLGGPFSLLMSGGPAWADRRTGYHAYSGLSLNF